MSALELLGIAAASQGPALARFAAAAGGRVVVAPAGDLLGLAQHVSPLGPNARDVEYGRQIAKFYAALQCIGGYVELAPSAPGVLFRGVQDLTRAVIANAEAMRPLVQRVSRWREFSVEVVCPADVVLKHSLDDPVFEPARVARAARDRMAFQTAVQDGVTAVRARWASGVDERLVAVSVAHARVGARAADLLYACVLAVREDDLDLFDLSLAEIDALAPSAFDIRVTGPSAPTSFVQVTFENAAPDEVRAAGAALGVGSEASFETIAAAVDHRSAIEPKVAALAERAARARASLTAAGERRREDSIWLAQVREPIGVMGQAA